MGVEYTGYHPEPKRYGVVVSYVAVFVVGVGFGLLWSFLQSKPKIMNMEPGQYVVKVNQDSSVIIRTLEDCDVR